MQRLNSLGPLKQTCKAVNAIWIKSQSDNTDEALYVQWLRQSLEDMRCKNDYLVGQNLTWNQGACQMLQELIDALESAHAIVKANL